VAENPPDLPTMMLIERAQTEDDWAMGALFERFLPRVRRIAAIRLGRQPVDLLELDDLVQEALFDAFKGLKNFDTRSDGRLVGWLSKIVENRLRATIRDGRTQKRGGGRVQRFGDHSQSLSPSGFAAATPTPSQGAMGSEMETRVRAAIDKLPATQREVVILRFYCELSYDEIAADLELSGPDSARALYSKALRAIWSSAAHEQDG
jgi:RNA polymerase sigma-70 factor (ECF subfamily)